MNQQKNKPKADASQGAVDQVIERLSPTAVAVLCALALHGLPMCIDALAYRLDLDPGRIAGSLAWLRYWGIVKDCLGFWNIQTPGWRVTLAGAVQQ